MLWHVSIVDVFMAHNTFPRGTKLSLMEVGAWVVVFAGIWGYTGFGCVMHCARKTCLFTQLPQPLFVLCRRSGSYPGFNTTLPSPFYLPSVPVFSPLPILFLPSPLLSRLLVRRHHCLFGWTTINRAQQTNMKQLSAGADCSVTGGVSGHYSRQNVCTPAAFQLGRF